MNEFSAQEGPGIPDPVEPDEFRLAMGRLASGVCVVAARWREMDHAMTASAVSSVSLDPPMVLFTVHVDSRFRDLLEDQPLWALSILTVDARASAQWLATTGRPLVQQFSTVPHHRGQFSGAALLDDSLAWLECSTSRIVSAGDHDVIIGDVLRAERANDATGISLVHFQSRLLPGPGGPPN